ncbi:MAG: DEAD/DEAH box helicase, partial [Planctomycetes bacterium]|nr:DEAD/DEAH box helicase [Planctomycetota bacterium]
MAHVETVAAAPDRLFELVGCLERQEGFDQVVAALSAGHAATLDGVWGSACALVAAALAGHAPAGLTVVCPHEDDVDPWVDDLALFTPLAVEKFPARETIGGERIIHDEAFGDRVRLLKLLGAAEPVKLLVTSIQALMQPVPSRDAIDRHTRSLAGGDTVEPGKLARWLVENGFHHTTAVELPGEFSMRGGIVDIFAPDWYDPVRIEFFGDQIESLRCFDVASQRSKAKLAAVDVTILNPTAAHDDHLASFLPQQNWFLLAEPAELEEEGRHYLQRVAEVGQCHSVAETMRRVLQFPSVSASGVAAGSLDTNCRLKIESVERFSGEIGKVRRELDAATAGQDVHIVCQTEAEARRLEEVFGQTELALGGRLHFSIGRLRSGFRLLSEQIVLLGGAELFHRTDLTRPAQRRLGRAIDSFLELREGDLVVHVTHGVARYRGLDLLEKDGRSEEHLKLEFAGRTQVYVPASKVDLVQKYVGGAKSRPKLAKLGGRAWTRQKEAVEKAVMDLAADMLHLQARRASRPGISFSVDTQWQEEFDASFPYRETADQETTIAAIKGDMRAPRPMDRLLCGDVGYGKTELAMRAAFKAVDAGHQVAMLVPTTVLAEQHHRTFVDRVSAFPFEVAVL